MGADAVVAPVVDGGKLTLERFKSHHFRSA